MMKRAYHRRPSERGITLLETLFVVGSIAILISVGTYILAQVGKQTVFERTASQLLEVQRGAEEYVKANFTQLLDVAVAGNIAGPGAVREVPIADLAADNYLTGTASDQIGKDLRVHVYIRNDTTAGNPDAIEIITATESSNGGDGEPFSDLLDTAWFGRGKIGVLANVLPYDTFNFRGITSEWLVPVTDLASAGYAPTITGGTDGRGYLAAYGRMDRDSSTVGNVLYRIPTGNPADNTMSADLSMGGHNLCGSIVGTVCSSGNSTVTVDRLNAANVVLTGNGGYALSTEGPLEVSGGLGVAGGVTVYGDTDITTPDLQTTSLSASDGRVSANKAVASQTLTVGADGLIANDAETGTMTSNELVVNNRLRVGGDNSSPGGSIETTNIQLGSTGGAALATGNLNTGTAIAGSTTVTDTYTANTNALHTITQNLRSNGSLTIGAVTAGEAQFQNLCYKNGPADDIEQCP